eukprot:TRINITY_DN16000_c0_g1_i1.p1 TRINITY_DN16000_c0_g1~~TRINITY_DN16000_c0_g1_i1.p1  ORF type:complete len:142 (+),score=27.13 TRINITY_DN16000_c0_g1_i1:51-428(+)
MVLSCEVCVDYLTQDRKPGRKSKTTLNLIRDEWHHICLVIGPKSKKLSFRVEGVIAKIYDKFLDEGKATVELHLPGGSMVNVLVSNANVEELKEFIKNMKIIQNEPVAAYELDLECHSEESIQSK